MNEELAALLGTPWFGQRTTVQLAETLSLAGLRIFLFLISVLALRRGKGLFLQRHGWSHRLAGLLLLIWLIIGVMFVVVDVRQDQPTVTLSRLHILLYDVVLGCLGTAATLSAARDFPHKYVKNARKGQSGTLEEAAIVTQSEMIEHSFYQFLNLWQALYLHSVASTTLSASSAGVVDGDSMLWSLLSWTALGIVTLPWWVRKSWFPVHSFSANWKTNSMEEDTRLRSSVELLLYRIKKWQYVFYKHVILHGVNLTLATRPSQLVHTRSWRIFWIALNMSYVMEFFLQSMVKNKRLGVLSQAAMLCLQRLLMTSSSMAALTILGNVRPELCLLSLVLNFWRRHHDVTNTLFIGGVMIVIDQYRQRQSE
eukprot:CAMPEP_0194032294 /NCGR_PEP_ID=MMETSP0009_2-20130614/5268_1 /TAXON_ID=210454 /ORGANISM="Grammatophora oceanica, Strain CCMP 410" /LENGTH=367 /DNA_ID=CAMNT_0038672687 /DNA_START=36 /DNA_END=1139 /DNA_ORIENTATION=+